MASRVVGARLDGPYGRWGWAAQGSSRPASTVRGGVARLLAGRGDRTRLDAEAARRDAGAGTRLARAEHRGRGAGLLPPAGDLPPTRAARPPLLVVGGALPRHRL